MRKTTIIHVADTHLGYKQYNSIQRRQDFFDAFEYVIDDAIKMGVDAVVHTGDLFDSRTPTLMDIVQTIQIVKKLKSANIPFLGIVGNHESKQDIQWLDLLEQNDIAKRLGTSPVYINDVAIYGIDFISRSKLLLYEFSKLNVHKDDTKHVILAMHQLINEVPCGIFDYRRAIDEIPFNINALILGDYHKYFCDKINDMWITYSGSTERNSIDEFDPRVYNILTCNENGISIQRKKINSRNFVFVPVTISETDTPFDTIMLRIQERMKSIPESVVIIDIDGNYKGVIPYADIEKYLLSNDAIACQYHDKRFIQEILGTSVPEYLVFLDPDEAVNEKLRQTPLLTEGGDIVDSIIRNMNISKSNVESETDTAIDTHLKTIDFDKVDTNTLVKNKI